MSPSDKSADAKHALRASARPSKRTRQVETIKVHVAPATTQEAIEVAIGQLVEEWAALTYSCMVEEAMAAPAVNDPMVSESAEQQGLPTMMSVPGEKMGHEEL